MNFDIFLLGLSVFEQLPRVPTPILYQLHVGFFQSTFFFYVFAIEVKHFFGTGFLRVEILKRFAEVSGVAFSLIFPVFRRRSVSLWCTWSPPLCFHSNT